MSYRKNSFLGLHFIVFGVVMILFALLTEATIDSSSDERRAALLDTSCGIVEIIGSTMVFAGVFNLCSTIKLGLFNNKYNIVDTLKCYYSYKNTLTLWIQDEGIFENIDIELNNLSDKTIDFMVTRLETPLKELYEVASKSDRAESAYMNCSAYMELLADDLKKAISQCENELMEQKLLDNLYIIENAIKNIKDKLNEAISSDKDEEEYLKELKHVSYEPFTLTDSMNKLL